MTALSTNGIFAVYKPTGITSHDVVNMVRRKTGVKRVGHGGTLDPLAEGVLVIAVGRENTKNLDKYVKGNKEYLATFMLGYNSDTDDKEGPIHEYIQITLSSDKPNTNHVPTLQEIKECVKKFTGEIMQTPPIYSAIKINGKEAYKYARAKRNKSLKPTLEMARINLAIEPVSTPFGQGSTLPGLPKMEKRAVFIKNIKILKYEYPTLELKIECGTGVYIRSLARDIGKKLKTGAYLEKLVRTRVGEFKLEDTTSVSDIG